MKRIALLCAAVSAVALCGCGPSITTQPQSVTKHLGEPATFTVVASGDSLTYQWEREVNGAFVILNDGDEGTISGATSATLTISAVAPNDGTTYVVVVGNTNGNTTSSFVDLNIPATITTGPMNQTTTVADDGEFFFVTDDVTFAVTAAGWPAPSYQWTFTGMYSGTTTPIPGATGPILTLPHASLDEAGTYTVTVQNAFGSDSRSATLTVNSDTGYFTSIQLAGTRSDFTFKGDTTYWLDQGAVVTLTGTTVIEGGAVIKYGQNAKIIVQGDIQCLTAPYSPAFFTAETDDTIGWYQWQLPDNPRPNPYAQYYAAVALDIQSTKPTQLHDLRISHASTAICYSGAISAVVVDTVRHVQVVHCGTAFRSVGQTSSPPHARFLDLGNVLVSGVSTAISGSYFFGRAQHLTVDGCGALVSDDAANGYGFFFPFINSILANVTSVGQGLDLTPGSNNGFYAGAVARFGAAPIPLTAYPFAPTTIPDGPYNWLTFENGQGYYYLADGSPLVDAGTTNIDPSLQADLARMTTTVPPPLFYDDINSSQTIGPRVLRDAGAPDVGYHYLPVDYVINGATVNNCTLNIDPGTVLALVSGLTIDLNTSQQAGYGYPWGLRLNAGARLNVNGVPTNRIVFARLETIQEHTEVNHIMSWYDTVAPYVTFDDIVCAGTPATPLAEARFKYADFRTSCGCSSSYGGFSRHFGPLQDSPDANYADPNYSMVGNLELTGCLFQGGRLIYDEGGPQNRVFGITNTIFDRCILDIQDTGSYKHSYNSTPQPAQVTAANNLFYQCLVPLYPVQNAAPGASWLFIDNVFDHVIFGWDYESVKNGPVGVNKNNAYIGMSGNPRGGDRLQPNTYASTDPVLESLAYDTGPLGRFYLPSTCSALLGQGSRTAGAAGEYHFTCLTNNQKEAAGQVTIGAHYLALDASGNPYDSNSDGVPDFIADRNGNGIEDPDETPWTSPNTVGIALLSAFGMTPVSGVIQVQVNLGTRAPTATWIIPVVDGETPFESLAVANPAQSLALIQIDTRRLENGTHTLWIRGGDSQPSDDGYVRRPETDPITFVTSNPVCFPRWENIAEQNIFVQMSAPPSSVGTLWLFDSSLPKSFSWPANAFSVSVAATLDGTVDYNASLLDIGVDSGNTTIYSVTEWEAGGSLTVNPATTQATPVPVPAGAKPWVVAYTDDGVDKAYYSEKINGAWVGGELLNTSVPQPIVDNPWTDHAGQYWLHDAQLGGWLLHGQPDPAEVKFAPSSPFSSGTWPLRTFDFESALSKSAGAQRRRDNDVKLLQTYLGDMTSVSFYGRGHGVENVPSGEADKFMAMSAKEIATGHRYRFVFLDGCVTASRALLRCFGVYDDELAHPAPIKDIVSSGGPRHQLDYAPGKTPGAFLGYDVYIPFLVFYDPVNHSASGGHFLHSYDALCNFHSTLVGTWKNVIQGKTLRDGLHDADIAFTQHPFGAPAPEASAKAATSFDKNGVPKDEIQFNPRDHLIIYGCSDLLIR